MTAETITRRYVQVHGRAVHYRHVGQGSPVVLLHAAPRSSASLVPLMRSAPAGLSLFAIDLPGFGRSSSLAEAGRSIDDFADALLATLDVLGLRRVRLYGKHTGAAVALAFAVRHAARVDRLVLDGLAAFSDAECADLDAYLPPLEPDACGTHMTWAWNRMRDDALFFPWNVRSGATRLGRPLPGPDALQAATLDLLVADDHRSAYAAAFRLDPRGMVQQLRVATHIGAREHDVLRPHLDRLGPVPPCVAVRPFGGDSSAWSAAIWALLHDGIAEPASRIVEGRWLASAIADTHRGSAGRRLHWRGCAHGSGRPLIYLHDSPGSARSGDRLLSSLAGRRPVYACDLPGHGESDAFDGGDVTALLDALDEGLHEMGLTEIELVGDGLGSWLAHWLVLRRPQRRTSIGRPRRRGSLPVPLRAVPRADGGHLNQAWMEACDAVIFGAWWCGQPDGRIDFGSALDLRAIHRAAIERLFEAPVAESLRVAIATRVCAEGRSLPRT